MVEVLAFHQCGLGSILARRGAPLAPRVFPRVPRFSEYSCFEKGCPTKPYATMLKGIMGSRGLWYLIEALGVSAT